MYVNAMCSALQLCVVTDVILGRAVSLCRMKYGSPVYMKDLYVYLLVEMHCCYDIFVCNIPIEIGLCRLVRQAVYYLSLLSLRNRSTEICLCLLLVAGFFTCLRNVLFCNRSIQICLYLLLFASFFTCLRNVFYIV
jgi:hypothetical protein